MFRIYALRNPKTNIQVLQPNVLLKYKYLVAFLRQHGLEVYSEVRAAYVDTLSSHFRAYLGALERLQVCFSSAVLL
jgi:vacuolar protein sorting-associated protein 52